MREFGEFHLPDFLNDKAGDLVGPDTTEGRGSSSLWTTGNHEIP
jgi:hypothetical protein